MKDSPLSLSRTPRETAPEVVASCTSGQSLHHSSDTKSTRRSREAPDFSFPPLKPDGNRHLWLSQVRDFVAAKSVTIATLHSHASGSRDPFSSIDSTYLVRELVSSVLAELDLEPFPTESISRWIELENRSPLYVSVVPAPESDRASLLIFEFDSIVAESGIERVSLISRLTAREARLVQEAERRISAEEMFYHSQKLNCIGQLAGGIAHDFNNLLTVIQGHTGFVEVAAQDWNDPKVIESIELIQNATSQSVGLVKQLLLFSRDQKADFETIDLNTVVGDFAKMIRRMVEETISLKLEFDPEAGHIRADKGMLSQILMNLVVNSRDSMPEGGEITILTGRRSTDDKRHPSAVSLIISDKGCGIASADLSRVFDPFYTTKPKGTGLGLANVSGLVRQHSGVIDISSEEGVGTKVEILFPVAKEGFREKPLTAMTERETNEKSIRGSRVLLVEDESGVRKLVRKLLEMYGCSVIEASSGRQALDFWDDIKDEVSVVVSDVVMPEGVSGWDLAKELHRRNPDLGILLTSGYNERPEDHGLSDAKNLLFLQKPYEAVRLKSNLYELIEGTKAS